MNKVLLLISFAWLSSVTFADLPAKFDLREKNQVTKVKKQSGGTCWAHGTMAALEGNLLVTGEWKNNGEEGQPNLAEYYLDWWNGFNEYYNADIYPKEGGLTIHEGGDYFVAAAFLSRGGVVRDIDGQSYYDAPDETDSSYHTYYVRDIEWLSAGNNLETIADIKKALMKHGVLGTALAWSESKYNESTNSFYQSPSSSADPNHAVAMVGWDDNYKTKASKPGAWLIKNSWGTSFGDGGYFWISYYDKTAGKHPEMGAVSFRNVERLKYDHIYYHDYHGWRDTFDGKKAMNAFQVDGDSQILKAVSFYTTADNVDYTIKIYKGFDGTTLSNPMGSQDGHIERTGFHTIDLNWPVSLSKGEKFYVSLEVSDGGQAFDMTSDVPLLLGASYRVTVQSKASPNESFYFQNGRWIDFTSVQSTGNFCIKALTVNTR